MSIMDIVAIGNKNWVKTSDGKWHHLAITDEGDTYFNGQLIPKIEITMDKPASEPPKKRWEILDIR